MNITTALLMFVCNDAYGCQYIAIPTPNMNVIQCMMQANQMQADWAAQLDGMARVHKFKCITIPSEPLLKGEG